MRAECDIILLSYENPDLLEKCVQSVLEHTRVPSRLIIVDNASKDPAVSGYLHKIHGNSRVSIEKVFSERNAGFAAGMNKGMRLSEAPFVCLLNNDCIVTEGWLEELIAVASSGEDIGIVNPQSNTFGSRPDEGASIDDHGKLLRYGKGRFVELGHAVGFACLIKRDLIDKIGYLDEAFRGVCYEDTDYSVRAQRAGYISVMAEGSYVYHFEQASRKDLKDREDVYRKNRELFEKRWGRLLRVLFFDPASERQGRVPERYETMKGLARQRMIVEMRLLRNVPEEGRFMGPDRRKMTRHADVSVRTFSRGSAFFSVLWRVMTKKKKFDAIIVPGGFLMRVLRLLKPFHGGEVFSIKKKSLVMAGNGMLYDLNNPSSMAEYLRNRKKRGFSG
ncbi:MAG: glycosyltransferase [Candidatus Omnitrophica bacterium]|nr:glycosyltransferase [Candidatus Omnitrophota bacterium]